MKIWTRLAFRCLRSTTDDSTDEVYILVSRTTRKGVDSWRKPTGSIVYSVSPNTIREKVGLDIWSDDVDAMEENLLTIAVMERDNNTLGGVGKMLTGVLEEAAKMIPIVGSLVAKTVAPLVGALSNGHEMLGTAMVKISNDGGSLVVDFSAPEDDVTTLSKVDGTAASYVLESNGETKWKYLLELRVQDHPNYSGGWFA